MSNEMFLKNNCDKYPHCGNCEYLDSIDVDNKGYLWCKKFNITFNYDKKDTDTIDNNYFNTPPAGRACPQCNTPIEEGEKFCSGCGAKVPKTQAEAPQTNEQSNTVPAELPKKVCSNCKKDLEPNWTVCPYCQTKVITLTCKKCGKELQEEWLVCPYCNTKTGPKLCAGCGKELQDEWKVCPFCSVAVGE